MESKISLKYSCVYALIVYKIKSNKYLKVVVQRVVESLMEELNTVNTGITEGEVILQILVENILTINHLKKLHQLLFVAVAT